MLRLSIESPDFKLAAKLIGLAAYVSAFKPELYSLSSLLSISVLNP